MLGRKAAMGGVSTGSGRRTGAGCGRAAHGLQHETAAQDPRFSKMRESYRRFRDEQHQWFRVVENSFENFAYAAAAARG